jgi:phosphatidylserine decarboxylase
MKIRPEVIPFVIAALVAAGIVAAVCVAAGVPRMKTAIGTAALAAVLIGYFLYFFRDPDRVPPNDPLSIVAGADGTIAKIVEIREDKYLKTDTVRISIFLSLFNVHVNRAPISGNSSFLGYFRGRHLFTFKEKSSEVNQHNKILIEGEKTRCLVTQIVGPVCRRVVYWPDHDKTVPLDKGSRIGMMKFGSRLDMYFPRKDVEVLAKEGDKVRAGETIIARIRREGMVDS